MKNFAFKAANAVVAKVTLSKAVFDGKFGGLPSEVFKAFVKQHPEYEDCTYQWTVLPNDMRCMVIYSLGNLVLEEQ